MSYYAWLGFELSVVGLRHSLESEDFSDSHALFTFEVLIFIVFLEPSSDLLPTFFEYFVTFTSLK